MVPNREMDGSPKSSTAYIREGEEVHNYNVARVEKYVDKDGNEKEAMAYGSDSNSLMVWYDWEEVKRFFKNWTVPDTPRWANTKKWVVTALLEKPKAGNKSGGAMRGSQRGNSRGLYRGNNSGRGRGGSSSYYDNSQRREEILPG